MRENLDESLKLVFGNEGGYSNRKSDKGGPTKYGITQATLALHRGHAVTATDVQELTLKEATEIYQVGYWQQSGGDLLPGGVDYEAFDYGVNSGPTRAAKTLQEVLKAKGVYNGKIDGLIGPGTLTGVKNYPGSIRGLITDYAAARMVYLQGIKNAKTGWPKNGRGWTIRVTGIDPEGKWPPEPGVIGNALALAAKLPVKVAAQPLPAGGDAKAPTPAPNPWVTPDVILPGLGAASGFAGIAAGSGPVQWALGVGFVALVGVGVFYVIRRITKTAAVIG